MMKLSTIVIIVLLIIALYYYTAQTFEVVEVVGKHVYAFIVGIGDDVYEEAQRGALRELNDDLSSIVEKIKEQYTKIREKH